MSRKLSPAQRACLEAAAKAPLRKTRANWTTHAGWNGHPSVTVEALARRGLLTIDRMAACAGEARITKSGRSLLAEEADHG